MNSRITLNINTATKITDVDRENIFTILNLWKPEYVLCMGMNGFTREIGSWVDQWGGKVVVRIFDGHEHNAWERGNGKYWADKYDYEIGRGTFGWHLLNEAAVGGEALERKSKMMAEFIDEVLKRDGAWAVVANEATASYRFDDVKLPAWKPFYLAMARAVYDGRNKILYGAHAYTAPPLWAGTAGKPISVRVNRQEALKRPTWEDIIENDGRGAWHIGREWGFLLEMARVGGISPYDIPVFISEFLYDAMPDLEAQAGDSVPPKINWTNTLLDMAEYGVIEAQGDVYDQIIQLNGGVKGRGITTWKNYNEWLFPDLPYAEAVAEQCQWVEEVHPPNYGGFAIFTYSRDDGFPLRWDQDYGVQHVPEFWYAWADRVKNLGNSNLDVKESEVVIDRPQNQEFIPGIIRLKDGVNGVNVRVNREVVDSSRIGVIRSSIVGGLAMKNSWENWSRIKFDLDENVSSFEVLNNSFVDGNVVEGWVSSQFIDFTAENVSPPSGNTGLIGLGLTSDELMQLILAEENIRDLELTIHSEREKKISIYKRLYDRMTSDNE